ncbi:hypothetical protein [Edwardsiella ictaluri]|nr:hypothetical protein [Edwardsiella ictaluri]
MFTYYCYRYITSVVHGDRECRCRQGAAGLGGSVPEHVHGFPAA